MYDKKIQRYFSSLFFYKNSLTGPGTFLLPFLPGFDLCPLLELLHLLLLGLLHALLLLHGDGAQPRRLPGPPGSSSWPPWVDATCFWSSVILPCDSQCTSFFHQSHERLLGFPLQSIQRIFLILFAAMGVQKMLVEWRFWSNLLNLAVKLADIFFGPTTHVLSWFAIVASTFEGFGDIRGSSSPQAEEAKHSKTHSISPAVDLVSWILPRSAFCIRALHWFPLKGSEFTNVRSRVLPAVSIIFIGNSSLPPALISASFSCMSFSNCDPQVGEMKMHDFQKFPSQSLFFLLFSIQREDSLQPLGRYTGLNKNFCSEGFTVTRVL